MITGFDWLALEVKYLEPAVGFYRDQMGLPISSRSGSECILRAGDAELVLRTPGPVPRGGVHTHFAFSIPRGEYDEWWDLLSTEYDLVEHRFGSMKSLYLDDPDGHCVELGQSSDTGSGITGIFEVVLEVESLDIAESFYSRLGASIVDRGSERRRVRLDLGPVDLELWEPHLGIADARGGVHVDLGLLGDAAGVATAIEGVACEVAREPNRTFFKDPDGHTVTVSG